jgi:hypothetical protein
MCGLSEISSWDSGHRSHHSACISLLLLDTLRLLLLLLQNPILCASLLLNTLHHLRPQDPLLHDFSSCPLLLLRTGHLLQDTLLHHSFHRPFLLVRGIC